MAIINFFIRLFRPRKNYGLDPEQAEIDSKDPRNLDLGATFGVINIKEVPNEDFFIGDERKELMHQRNSDMCTGFGTALAQSVQEGVKISPEFQFMVGKKERGDWRSWGNGFHQVLKGAVKYGSLKQSKTTWSLKNKTRNFLANWNNWHDRDFKNAEIHKKASYFQVTGRYDTFDNIRAALWQHRKYKRIVMAGAFWRGNWSRKGTGIIPESDPVGGTGHFFCIDGQRVINGKIYLRSANSYGDTIGDDGYHYWSRKAINRQFIWGAGYMLVDIERSVAEILNMFAGKIVAVKAENPEIYLVKAGKKHHILSENVLNALNFELKESEEKGFRVIDQADLDKIPKGKEITVADLSNPMQQLFTRNKLN